MNVTYAVCVEQVRTLCNSLI